MVAVARAVRAFCASVGLIVIACAVGATVDQVIQTARERDRLRAEVERLRSQTLRRHTG